MDISGVLNHEQNVSSLQTIETTGLLQSIDAVLYYDSDELVYGDKIQSLLSANALSPASLELTIIDPMGRAVAIGGADSSLGIADITTEW
jgi:hypothetical protein